MLRHVMEVYFMVVNMADCDKSPCSMCFKYHFLYMVFEAIHFR